MNRMKQRISDWQPRKLLCFSAAFSMMAVMVTLLASYDKLDLFLPLAIGSILVSASTALFFKEKLIPFTTGLLIGVIWCFAFLQTQYIPAQALIGYGGRADLQVLNYPSVSNPNALIVKIENIAGKEVGAKAQLYLDEPIENLAPGDLLQIDVVIRAGNVSLQANRLQKGIYLTLYPMGDTKPFVITGGAADIFSAAKKLSKSMQDRICTLIPGESGNLLAAMMSGDSSLCSSSFRKALTNTGLSHIAAVSGLHISILAGFFVTLLGKRKGFLVAFPLIVCYALITGASPSAVRAVIMQGILMISVYFYREYDPMTALFAALLCLVVQNPFAVLSISLVLSFSATYGILLLNRTLLQTFSKIKPKSRLGAKLYWWVISTASVSFSAMIFTIPITLWIFGRASMLSLISNILTIWAVGISIICGMLLLSISLLYMPAAIIFAKLVELPLKYLVWVIQSLGSLTIFVGHAGSLIFETGAIFALVCMILVRISKRDRAWGILVSCLILTVSFLISSIEPLIYNQVLIYESYGAPIMLIRDAGRTILVGTGSNSERSCAQLEDALTTWGRSQISTIICLSDRIKSVGSLSVIAQQYEPEDIFVPEETYIDSLETESVWWYSGDGRISVPDTTGNIELISITEEIWAMRWIAKDVSILMLYDGEPLKLAVGVEGYQGNISADILITDAKLLNSSYAASYICSQVSPTLILAADSKFDTLPDAVLGVPVVSLNQQGPITLTTKR